MASHANFVDIFAIVFLSDIWIIGHELKNTGDNMRKIHANVPVLFRPEPWTVTEERFEADKSYNNETIFTVGNGYLGVRGYSEEGVPAGTPTERSALINGVYEYHPYHHIWCRPGFPPRYHSVFAQADPFRVCVLADGELCTPASGGKYSRVLDMRGGTMVRTFEFRTSSGKRVNLSFERFASFSDVHVLMHRVRVSSPDGAVITAVSDFSLPGYAGGAHKEEIGGDNSVRFLLQGQKREKAYRCLRYAAAVSGFSVACALGERAEGFSCEEKDAEGSLINEYKALPGAKEFLLERAAAYYSDAEGNASADDALRSCRAAMKAGYDAMASRTAEIWKRFWDNADIVIDGDDLVQQGVRFSLFMLNSSVGRDGKTNIGANGLTGTGYMGHTFWDTEIFMTPAFLYTDPLIARRLLEYRYSILPNAEKRAAEMEDEGALYSWNSINGEECGHVFEAATAQYHLNCDIAFAIKRYYNATADWDFMCECGIEILAKMSKCISHRGTVTCITAGETTITVTSKEDPSKSDSFTLTVSTPSVPVSSVSITNKTDSAKVGDSLTLKVSVSPSNASDKSVTYASSDTSVATVEDGVVSFLKAGTVTITVKSVADPSKSDSFTVTVTEKDEDPGENPGGDPGEDPTDPEPSGGCSSAVFGGSMALALVLAGGAAAVLRKKKH